MFNKKKELDRLYWTIITAISIEISLLCVLLIFFDSEIRKSAVWGMIVIIPIVSMSCFIAFYIRVKLNHLGIQYNTAMEYFLCKPLSLIIVVIYLLFMLSRIIMLG